MTSFATRPARPEDENTVTALLEASYPQLMPEAYSDDVLAAALPAMTRANLDLLASGTFHVAEHEDRVIGCGGWTAERPGNGEVVPGLGHVRHFATHPDWTGRGVGKAIFQTCRLEAGEAGIVTFECYASLNAEKFYAALGFIVVEPFVVELKPGLRFDSLLMRMDL